MDVSQATDLKQSITESDLARFRTDGAVCLRSVIAEEWVERLRDSVTLGIEEPSPNFNCRTKPGHLGRYITDTWVHGHSKGFRSFCEHSNVARIATSFLGVEQARLLFDSWVVKYPGTLMRTPWHQDTGIHGLSVVVWVPLDTIRRGAGLEVVRGSHRWERNYYSKHFEDVVAAGTVADGLPGGDYKPAEVLPDIDGLRESLDILKWDVEPGDCIVLNALVVHGAAGNPYMEPARRYSTRWMVPTAVLAPHGKWIAEHLRKNAVNMPTLQSPMQAFDDEDFPLLPCSNGD